MNAEADLIPNDPYGAFCRENHVALPPTGHGPLDGLTFGAKDVFDIAGVKTGFGNPDWLATHEAPSLTASVVTDLLAAGACMRGKTLCDELTYSLVGANHHYGTPRNVAAPGRVPGGSSNGSAVAVAAGLVDFSIGTDCAGSVRIPASYCGILGMRPTHGRVAVDNVLKFAESFDVVGWFARDAEILERVGSVICAYPPAREPLRRLVIAEDAFQLLAPDVQAAARTALQPIVAALGPARPITVSAVGLRAWVEIFRVVQGAEIWANRREWIEQVQPLIGPGIRERLAWAATIQAGEAAEARKEYLEIRAALRTLLAPDEVLVLPTSPRVAPLCDLPVDLLENEYRMQAMCLLCIAGLGGMPQASLPLARVDGLPLGVSLLGPPDSDLSLLALTRQIMAAA